MSGSSRLVVRGYFYDDAGLPGKLSDVGEVDEASQFSDRNIDFTVILSL